MSHLSHPIKAALVSIVTTKNYDSEIHAQGCMHEKLALRVSPQTPESVPSENDNFEDDWYHVAPCARKAS